MIRENRDWIWKAAAMSIFLFFIFKLFYPNPNMVMDSYMYIDTAVSNRSINAYPIGYSRFMQLFCFFCHSATVFVWYQYLLLETACLLFYLTILHFFRPSKATAYIIFVFLFCNPLFSYLSNFIMSDTVFIALSIGWVVQMIWVIYRPRRYMVFVNGGILFFAFTIRYNALWYPMIASLALLLTRLSTGYKIAAILLQFGLIGAFVVYTRTEAKQATGAAQFSPFGGWQLANNALYMYGHTDFKQDKPVPAPFRDLDSAVRYYFDSSHRQESLLNYEAEGPGFYYMVSGNSPLIRYMIQQTGIDQGYKSFPKWGAMGYLYSGYGSYLIRSHPMAYLRYWVWPNSIRFFYPPAEIFWRYSPYFIRTDSFCLQTTKLFNIKTLAASWPLIKFRTDLFSWYPMAFMLLHLFFFLALAGFFLFGGVKVASRTDLYVFGFIVLLWLANFGFSVTASCVVLRYEIFSVIVAGSFALIWADRIYAGGTKAAPKVVKKESSPFSYTHE